MHIFSVEHKTAEWAAIRMEGSQGSSSMKISNVFTKLAPTLFIFFFYGLRFTFLSLTIRGVACRSGGVAFQSGTGSLKHEKSTTYI